MKVLTEADLRVRYRQGDRKEIHVQEGTFVTPTALEYIKDKSLKLIFDGSVLYSKKPEHMTHLRGNILVPKSHPRIVCRGKLDSLQAKILEVQVIARRNAEFMMAEELQQLLDLTRRILSCEVKDEPLPPIMLLGLNDSQLREMSHHPHKHFGIEHILPSCAMGEVVVALNSVRTAVRETEIAAINAFSTEVGLEREDLIKALNRLSSAVYLLICRKLSGGYEKVDRDG
jgi:ethanolamine utilization cobalamin adenosyltransferase